jgi:hypothetical protein
MSATTAPKPLKSFTFFPWLPPEVQCAIWAEACKSPRVIAFTTFQDFVEPTSAVPPAILHTSRLAREVALKAYTYVYLAPAAKFYFNTSVDTIYFREATSRDIILSSLKVKISPSDLSQSTSECISSQMDASGTTCSARTSRITFPLSNMST